jgi:hypothetical protein
MMIKTMEPIIGSYSGGCTSRLCQDINPMFKSFGFTIDSEVQAVALLVSIWQ